MTLARDHRDAEQHARRRVWRGITAGVLATTGTTLAHHVGGAPVPSLPAIVTTLVATTLVATALAGRRLSTARVLVLAATAQVVFHTMFTVLGTHDVAVSVTPGHQHAVVPADWLTAGGPTAGGWHPMFWSHLLATVLITVLVTKGEALACRSVAGLLVRVRRAADTLAGLPAPEPMRSNPPRGSRVTPRPITPLAVAPARGPPALVV